MNCIARDPRLVLKLLPNNTLFYFYFRALLHHLSTWNKFDPSNLFHQYLLRFIMKYNCEISIICLHIYNLFSFFKKKNMIFLVVIMSHVCSMQTFWYHIFPEFVVSSYLSCHTSALSCASICILL